MTLKDEPIEYPTDRKVVEVMDAAGGATEDAVMQCIAYLSDERGLKPGTRNGPRAWAWFPIVVREHFDRQRTQRDSAYPFGEDRNVTGQNRADRLSTEQFEAMTSAIEGLSGETVGLPSGIKPVNEPLRPPNSRWGQERRKVPDAAARGKT